jgi:16S rRNA (cytosine1402-N4)-methyltransferase
LRPEYVDENREETYHIPVMSGQVLDILQIREDGFYIDCTLGGGGHAEAMLEQGARVLGIDRDSEAIAFAVTRLGRFGERFQAVRERFSNIAGIVGIHAGTIDGVLMDLGVSSRMIDNPSRGFSYLQDGPLAMDMGLSATRADEIVNSWDKNQLANLFRTFGEERKASQIAQAIVRRRASSPISTTTELAQLIEKTVGGRFPQKSKARIFQALRIAVNEELDELGRGLEGARDVLTPGGRLCVISYHSLEDRLVKKFIRDQEHPCVCPPDLPICRCGRQATMRVITRKPIKADEKETTANPRARSAILRAAEKTGDAQ